MCSVWKVVMNGSYEIVRAGSAEEAVEKAVRIVSGAWSIIEVESVIRIS